MTRAIVEHQTSLFSYDRDCDEWRWLQYVAVDAIEGIGRISLSNQDPDLLYQIVVLSLSYDLRKGRLLTADDLPVGTRLSITAGLHTRTDWHEDRELFRFNVFEIDLYARYTMIQGVVVTEPSLLNPSRVDIQIPAICIPGAYLRRSQPSEEEE